MNLLFYRTPVFNLIIAFSLVTTTALAQISGFEISGGGGVTTLQSGSIQLKNLSTIGEDNRIGGNAFSRLEIDLGTPWIKVSPGVFFVQKGTQETHNQLNTVGQNLADQKIRLNYAGINIPLSIYIPFNKEDTSNGFALYGGGFADYAISGNYTDTAGKLQDLQFGEDPANRLDWGFSIGTGISLKGVVLRIGYDQGLKEIDFFTASSNGLTNKSNITNSGLFVTLGFTQPIGAGN